MTWLTPGIETNVAYATCMLLFGLLVLSVRNRKMASRSSYSSYASPLFARKPSHAEEPNRRKVRAARQLRSSIPDFS